MEHLPKKKQLQFFTSFEAAKEAEYKALALMTPQEHLASTMALIKRIYGYTGAPPKQRKITHIGYAEYFHE